MRIVFCAAVFVLLLVPAATWAAPGSPPSCQFVLGFKAFHDLIPAIVGDCLENEHFNVANGDSLQQTSAGLLVWRKIDNWTAFTDGYRTWVHGPTGVQERLNTERFPWERDPITTPPPPTPTPSLDPTLATGCSNAAAIVMIELLPSLAPPGTTSWVQAVIQALQNHLSIPPTPPGVPFDVVAKVAALTSTCRASAQAKGLVGVQCFQSAWAETIDKIPDLSDPIHQADSQFQTNDQACLGQS